MNRRGFTLIELMIGVVVMVIVSLLGLIAISNYGPVKELVKAASLEQKAYILHFMVTDYATEHQGIYPEEVSDLVVWYNSKYAAVVALESLEQKLSNPYTGQPQLPVDGEPTVVGQIGYRAVYVARTAPRDYEIWVCYPGTNCASQVAMP